MPRAKIVIETSTLKKEPLYQILERHQQTLNEWLDEQAKSLIEPDDLVGPLHVQEISSAAELADSTEVLANLTTVDWAFTDADTGYLTHGLHPYPAKFIICLNWRSSNSAR